MGIEPTSSAWKAEVLPLNYTRNSGPGSRTSSPVARTTGQQAVFVPGTLLLCLVEGGGFEPPKAEPADLQSAPFGHSGTPPKRKPAILGLLRLFVNRPLARLLILGSVCVTHLPTADSNNGAGERIRTPDRLITNQLLYQLSYASTRLALEAAYSSSLSGATLTSGEKIELPV